MSRMPSISFAILVKPLRREKWTRILSKSKEDKKKGIASPAEKKRSGKTAEIVSSLPREMIRTEERAGPIHGLQDAAKLKPRIKELMTPAFLSFTVRERCL